MDKAVFLCAGGDLRQVYMCEKLCAFGKVYELGIDGAVGAEVLSSTEDMPEMADVLVLPLLSCGDSIDIGGEKVRLESLVSLVKTGGLVLGGRISAEQEKLFSQMGLQIEDYFKRESLAVKNSIPTAEGALMIAMVNSADTVFGSDVLVIGFGRTGKCCARLFKAAGAECSVAARRPEVLAQAWSEGFDSFPLIELAENIGRFDTIINTVPAMVLTEDVLASVKTGCTVIDLASKPGGTDFAAAKRLEINAIHALALPGKAAPAAAGRMIAETIREITDERGITNCQQKTN
ncbi:dipicolinate synthase subunit DpsA [Ruminococcus albus]|uniref:Dipicolinate synthase subunit A n=1 Tax=Ruminococcus albus TaxID=1264 RepID=A0A1I1GGC1_RUMAL|nr:dipicolinate synthase subunit DpsA [Ruminococcus albus]SFC10847.1 dipicolinate synthase subunit A [Ruminococcus albus]